MSNTERNPDRPLADGDTASAEKIYREHYGRIYVFMCARFSDLETARDLAQEVFVRFFKTNPSLPQIRAGVSPYLYGVARNVVSDHFSDKNPVLQGESIDALPEPPVFPEQRVLDGDSLGKCLTRLRDTDKEIVIQHFWMGRGHEETARALGLNHVQVRQRFHRALQKLKQCLRARR